MARRDAEGYIHLVDRKSNMIITGGENVYPSEVESVLGRHPAVKDVAVIGVPDPKWGEAVTRWSWSGPGATRSGRRARALVPAASSPATSARRGMRFVRDEEMPRTATGKILHRVLRDRFAGPGGARSG